MRLDKYLKGRSDGKPLISIQPMMSEVANGVSVDEKSLFDMDACYETFDKDGYVQLVFKTFFHTS